MTAEGTSTGGAEGTSTGGIATGDSTPRLVVVDDSQDPQALAQQDWPTGSHLLLLFWCAGDTLALLNARDGVTCHGPMDVLGGLAHWEQRSAQLAKAVCDAGPSFQGQPWRRLIEEPLYYEAFDVVAILRAFETVQKLRRASSLRDEDPVVELRLVPSRLRLWRTLDSNTGAETASTPWAEQSSVGGDSPSLAGRLWRRVQQVVTTGDLWGQLWKLMDQVDGTYRGRVALHRRLRAPRVGPGGITFFSTYRNNSRNLKYLEDALGRLDVEGAADEAYRPTWLVTNRDARLQRTDGPVHKLYQFAGPPVDAPAEPDLPELTEVAARWHDQASDNAAMVPLLQAWLRHSPTWGYWRQRGHRALPQLAACWQQYLKAARPRLIVMANQWSLEGWMTHMARRQGIPVLQTMHGILGGEYHTNSPVRSDALLVQGTFWRQLWPQDEQRKIHVLPLSRTRSDPSRPSDTVERSPDVPRLTYLSWPVEQLPFYNAHELRDGFLELFHRLLGEKACRIHILCHPKENPADLLAHWNRLHGAWPEALTWGQGEPMHEVMARTDVALMYRSTTMLDCFAHGVPFVLPGWIDFSWRAGLQGLEGTYVADGFTDLEATLRRWLRQPPGTLSPEQQEAMLGPVLSQVEASRRLGAVMASLVEEGAP